MDTSPIDLAIFTELRDTVGADFAIELVDTFLEETPGILAELRTALAASDAVAYRRAAHSLKSNGATFGAVTLASMARDAELGGFAGDPVNDAAVVDAINDAYVAAAAKLSTLSRG